jgi:hypothetical protein
MIASESASSLIVGVEIDSGKSAWRLSVSCTILFRFSRYIYLQSIAFLQVVQGNFSFTQVPSASNWLISASIFWASMSVSGSPWVYPQCRQSRRIGLHSPRRQVHDDVIQSVRVIQGCRVIDNARRLVSWNDGDCGFLFGLYLSIGQI